MKVAIIEGVTEYERGWGNRPDGHLLYLTKEDREIYLKWFHKDDTVSAPDDYSKENGNPKVIQVSDSLYNELNDRKVSHPESPGRWITYSQYNDYCSKKDISLII